MPSYVDLLRRGHQAERGAEASLGLRCHEESSTGEDVNGYHNEYDTTDVLVVRTRKSDLRSQVDEEQRYRNSSTRFEEKRLEAVSSCSCFAYGAELLSGRHRG